MTLANNIYDTLTANVRAQMTRNSTSVKGLSRVLGITVKQVRMLLSGEDDWTLSQLVLVSHSFRVNPHEMLGTNVDPPACPKYTWCSGHYPNDDPDEHDGIVGYAVAGDSEIETTVSIANGDVQFAVNFGTWYIRADDIDSELVDLHDVLGQIRVGLKTFTAEVKR